MSARKRVILYRFFLLFCGLATVIGTVVIACNAIDYAETDHGYLWAFGAAVAALVLIPLNTLTHEIGHLTAGALVGMRFSSVRFSRLRIVKVGKKVYVRFLRFKEVAGSCEMYPGSERGVRGKMIFYSLGGAIFNLAYAGALIATVFIFPMHPILYFFQLFAPLNLLEAAACLYPVQTATGKTDGETVRGLTVKDPSSVVALHVLTPQGTLCKGTFADIDESFLFQLPVVREDDPAFLALTHLRWQYLFAAGREQEAFEQLLRLEELYAYLPEINRADVACDLVYFYSLLRPDLSRAKEYLADAGLFSVSCAYLRAMAAYTCMTGEHSDYFAEAKECAAGEPIVGVAELEKYFLARIEGEVNEKSSA